MKITLSYIKNLLREAAGDESCPAAAQDKRLNKRNKRKAAANPKIRLVISKGFLTNGSPQRPQIKTPSLLVFLN